MKATLMIYDKSLKKVKKLYPDYIFEGYENSFGSKCWISISGIRPFTVIKTLLQSRVTILRAE